MGCEWLLAKICQGNFDVLSTVIWESEDDEPPSEEFMKFASQEKEPPVLNSEEKAATKKKKKRCLASSNSPVEPNVGHSSWGPYFCHTNHGCDCV